MDCNLQRRTISFTALFMLSAISWFNDTHTHIYMFCKISSLNYVVEVLRKYPWGNYSSKVAGCRRTVGGWTPFFNDSGCKSGAFFLKHQFFMSANLKSSWFFLYFSDRSISHEIMYIHEIKSVFLKIWKKVFDFNFFFIWMKNLLVEDFYYHGKRFLTGKVNIFNVQKCFLSLLSESLKNIHERILVFGLSQNQSSKGVLLKRCPKKFSQCLQEIVYAVVCFTIKLEWRPAISSRKTPAKVFSSEFCEISKRNT